MVLYNDFRHDVRVYKEAVTLVDAGHDVTIVACKSPVTKHKEDIDGIHLIRVDVPESRLKKKLSFLKKQSEPSPAVVDKKTFKEESISESHDVSWFEYFRRLVWGIRWQINCIKTVIDQKADVYHGHDVSGFIHAYIGARKNKAKIVYDSHELHSQLTYLKHSRFPRLRKKVENFIERFLIKRVDKVIVVSESIADYMEKNFSIPRPLILMNCPLSSHFKDTPTVSGEDIKRIEALKRQGKKILLIQGRITPERGFEEFIEAIRLLGDDIIGLIVGGGPLQKPLEQQVQADKTLAKKIIFTGQIPFDQLLNYTRLADVGFIMTQNTCLNSYFSLPNKLFEYMLVGIPIVASNLLEIRNILEKYNIGIVVNERDPVDIADKMTEFLADATNYRTMGKNALRISREKFIWEKQAIKLVDCYKGLEY